MSWNILKNLKRCKISIEKAAMLYNRYEKDKMMPDDLEGLLGRVNSFENDYTFVCRYLTHQVIVMLDEELGKTLGVMARNDVNFDAVFAELEKYDAAFESMEQANKFVSAYADLVNNTRMWENCGYTPTQMRTMDGNIKVRK